MKNKVRVHHNGGKNNQPSQVQTRIIIKGRKGKYDGAFEISGKKSAVIQRDAREKGCNFAQWIQEAVDTKFSSLTGPEFCMPKEAKNHACLAIYDRVNQMPVSKIPISENEYYELWRRGIGGKNIQMK